MTTLVACSHGTSSPDGRAEIVRIREGLARTLPEVKVREAYVDVEQPEVADVVAEALGAEHGAPGSSDEPGAPVVVVPLLLSTGFHTSVDIAAAVAPHPGALAAPALGPHPGLVRVLRERLAEVSGGDAGHRPGDHVVLAAAGSTDPAAALAVEEMRAQLAAHLPCPVSVGYGAGCSPRLPDAVAAARAGGARRVIAASYVLAPGHFAGLVEKSGADLVTAPLGAHPEVIVVAAERFRSAADALAVTAS
ncbi:sirohydrochlorin chelatase [Brachybacterium aquaticum]|uniref:Sirohydrochlorin ferrochelatase n=1 Tax=Brachybacterium aquaticum TaxID=1432564 RepID=A0A841ACA4_9MICO|nr:CbiX/SirB N-terminal domain-containing protein [Brachybacterium aquaticum]MBB5832869.1 sirohydrochlorin ferrochelatase [Brachybacterium aquaticum]